MANKNDKNGEQEPEQGQLFLGATLQYVRKNSGVIYQPTRSTSFLERAQDRQCISSSSPFVIDVPKFIVDCIDPLLQLLHQPICSHDRLNIIPDTLQFLFNSGL